MHASKRNSGRSSSQVPAPDLSGLERLRQANFTVAQLCAELSKAFRVQASEVALLRLEENSLRFLFPMELKAVGSIPLSSSAVAAHTAASRKPELFNRFAKVKHASVFEVVKLRQGEGNEQLRVEPIQKLMSVPILDPRGRVLGVIQISRKAPESCLAGPDFTREDLRQLERAAGIVAETLFAPDTAASCEFTTEEWR